MLVVASGFALGVNVKSHQGGKSGSESRPRNPGSGIKESVVQKAAKVESELATYTSLIPRFPVCGNRLPVKKTPKDFDKTRLQLT